MATTSAGAGANDHDRSRHGVFLGLWVVVGEVAARGTAAVLPPWLGWALDLGRRSEIEDQLWSRSALDADQETHGASAINDAVAALSAMYIIGRMTTRLSTATGVLMPCMPRMPDWGDSGLVWIAGAVHTAVGDGEGTTAHVIDAKLAVARLLGVFADATFDISKLICSALRKTGTTSPFSVPTAMPTLSLLTMSSPSMELLMSG